MDRIRRLSVKVNNKKRYYRNIEYPEIPLNIEDLYIVTGIGDRLDSLAYKYYGDSELWWIISCGNPGVVRRDSFFMPVGLQIRIPAGIEDIKRNFEELNS
jgi:phage tail protein X